MLSSELEVYNAVLELYGRDRSTLNRDPYLLAEMLVEDGYLLVKPLVDEVIHAQDLLREVES